MQLLQELLSLRLPDSYREFLISRGADMVYGLLILGLPVNLDEASAWGATELVRALRPDLGHELIAIRLTDTRALCLDLRDSPSDDAPLVEVSLQSNKSPIQVHRSFRQYIETGQHTERHIEGALKHTRRLLNKDREKGREYDHASPGKKPFYRAHQWRVMRSCVHHHVVGLTAIKHNESMNALEVDVFLTTDHPDYEPGHGVRALAVLLLSDAYRNGPWMELRFTRRGHGTGARISSPVPRPLMDLAGKLGVSFNRGAEGVIGHDEAVRLYAAIVGFCAEALKAAQRCETQRMLRVEGLCYLASSRLWTVEEVTYILLNCPEPHRVLFGVDVPEDRLRYAESLGYGRAAIAATRLCHRLSGGHVEAEGSCGVEILGPIWRITPHASCQLDWGAAGDAISLVAAQSIIVLPRPRIVFPDEEQRIREDAMSFPPSDDGTPRYLVYACDHRRLDGFLTLAAELRNTAGIDILVLPFNCQELDEEVDRRMSWARVLRP